MRGACEYKTVLLANYVQLDQLLSMQSNSMMDFNHLAIEIVAFGAANNASLSLPTYLWCFFHFGFFFHPGSDPFLPFLISFFCHRRSNILGVRVKREFSENENKVQVFCISFALHSCRLSVIIILIYVAFCRMLAELHLNIEDWNPW